MARPLRIEYQDAWYHVMNRGRRGENVFSDHEDCSAFIYLLSETSKMFNLRVSAYCLMKNHYHILVQTPDGNLSRAMRHVNGVYTQRYNRRWSFDGQLFRGRYKSVLVEEDGHLLELLRYIHRNPVLAQICHNVGDYPWSSHPAYTSSAKKWDWLHRKSLLCMFADTLDKAQRRYKRFVHDEDTEEVIDFFSKKHMPAFFGTEDFVEGIKEKYYGIKKHHEIPQSRQLAPTVAEIKEIVCKHYAIDEQSLLQSKRGRINEPRNMAVYLARKLCGFPLEEIGREFGIAKYSSVSSIVTRTEKHITQHRHLSLLVEEMGVRLGKG